MIKRSDSEITTKVYEECKFTSYKPITSRTEILEEVKRVLITEKNKNNDCISLYDVLILLRKLYNEYDNIEKRCKNRCNYIVKSKIHQDSSVIFYGLDYEKQLLHISFNKYCSSDWKDIYFSKRNGDLYVVKSECCWTDEVFSALSSCLSEMYDELLKYNDYKDYKFVKYNRKPVNSNFNVKISYHGIYISVKDFENRYMNELELFAPSHKNSYELMCNSSVVNGAIKGKEEEIFKRIYVKISDCPEWSQDMLYKIRQNQLEEEQRIEDEIKYKQMKKQKRLELTRKIFPFLKK